jgi:hypothetical protein
MACGSNKTHILVKKLKFADVFKKAIQNEYSDHMYTLCCWWILCVMMGVLSITDLRTVSVKSWYEAEKFQFCVCYKRDTQTLRDAEFQRMHLEPLSPGLHFGVTRLSCPFGMLRWH